MCTEVLDLRAITWSPSTHTFSRSLNGAAELFADYLWALLPEEPKRDGDETLLTVVQNSHS